MVRAHAGEHMAEGEGSSGSWQDRDRGLGGHVQDKGLRIRHGNTLCRRTRRGGAFLRVRGSQGQGDLQGGGRGRPGDAFLFQPGSGVFAQQGQSPGFVRGEQAGLEAGGVVLSFAI